MSNPSDNTAFEVASDGFDVFSLPSDPIVIDADGMQFWTRTLNAAGHPVRWRDVKSATIEFVDGRWV